VLRSTDLMSLLLLAAACWALRLAFVVLVPADRLPARLARALQHLAPAALASICAVEMTGALDPADLGSTTASLAIVAVAAAVAVRTRNMTWTVLSGVAAVLLVDLVLLAA
jgi:branched-subunit amino acid transport protein